MNCQQDQYNKLINKKLQNVKRITVRNFLWWDCRKSVLLHLRFEFRKNIQKKAAISTAAFLYNASWFLKIKLQLNSFNDITWSDATGTYILSYSSVVYKHFDFFNVRFPHFVSFFMWMAHVATELNAFSAYFTFCHLSIPWLRIICRQ